MLSQEVIERLSERLVNRVNELNVYILEKIGKQLREMGSLTPSQLRTIFQSVKYGNDINDIANKLAEVTNKNVKDIYEIFEETAKANQEYAKQYYKYKKIKYIPYDENALLQNQVKALANITVNIYLNFSRTTVMTMSDINGLPVDLGIQEAYKKAIDKAIIGASQGRESYSQTIRQTMKELANSGVKTVNYEIGFRRRLDSAVRMNIMDGIRSVNRELQTQFGKEFGADGVEVSHHKNSAKDHEHTVDGKQFGNDEYKVINDSLDRQVGTLNCYHFIYPIVLGVSKPNFTKEELEEDRKRNEKGFEFEEQHYTMYEGTQLQRRIETAIRRKKEEHIAMKSINDKEEMAKAKKNISMLTSKYNGLSKISGLPKKIDRLVIRH